MIRPIEVIIITSLAIFTAGMGGYYCGLKRGQKIVRVQGPAMFLTNGEYRASILTNCACAGATGQVTNAEIEPVQWRPKIGDRVATTVMMEDGDTAIWRLPHGRIVTITNVVYAGRQAQSGWLVYGDGLPGVDSSWVKPAP